MIARYRRDLPQLTDDLFLTDGGIETTLIYGDGFELPHFAAFALLRSEAGREALMRYFRAHAMVAVEQRAGFVLESPTWRASADWGKKLGYTSADLAVANHEAIALLHRLRCELENVTTRMVISGCIGPRGDGYKAEAQMTGLEAEVYHGFQAAIFAEAGVDLVTAITMTYAEEAVGIVRAAQGVGLPVVISFTTETDGRLPSGQTLSAAISQVDAQTGRGPAYYMINCAHPTHFAQALVNDEPWVRRIRGIRANASTKCHAELDACTELDAGNPADLARRYAELRRHHPWLTVLGGCCGTDHRHIRAIACACSRNSVTPTLAHRQRVCSEV